MPFILEKPTFAAVFRIKGELEDKNEVVTILEEVRDRLRSLEEKTEELEKTIVQLPEFFETLASYIKRFMEAILKWKK